MKTTPKSKRFDQLTDKQKANLSFGDIFALITREAEFSNKWFAAEQKRDARRERQMIPGYYSSRPSYSGHGSRGFGGGNWTGD